MKVSLLLKLIKEARDILYKIRHDSGSVSSVSMDEVDTMIHRLDVILNKK